MADYRRIANEARLIGTTRVNAAKIIMWAEDNGVAIADALDSHDALTKALINVRKIIADGAMTGFNWKDGDWADRLFASQQVTSAALATLAPPPAME